MSSPGVSALKPEQGMFELTLLNAEASDAAFDDVAVDLLDRGLPAELVTRLKELWEQAKSVAGEVVAIGKIIVTHIVDFLRQNPKLAIGLALGVAVSVLIGGIPWIGGFLQPLATWLATLSGAALGAAMDKGDYSGSLFSAALALAEKFFELMTLIFNAVTKYLDA